MRNGADNKLDRVGSVDSRPFASKLKMFDVGHVTCDFWHVTRDMWHMTYNTRHQTHHTCWQVNILSKFHIPSLYGLGVKGFWRFWEKGSASHLINYEGVCRTAPATRVLLLWIQMHAEWCRWGRWFRIIEDKWKSLDKCQWMKMNVDECVWTQMNADELRLMQMTWNHLNLVHIYFNF